MFIKQNLEGLASVPPALVTALDLQICIKCKYCIQQDFIMDDLRVIFSF